MGLLSGKSIVVTGASKGIGYAVAGRLAREGAWVGMVARSEQELREAAERVGGTAIAGDVSNHESVDAIRSRVEEHVGAVPDAVVNCAGAFVLAPFAETTAEQLDTQLAANLRGPFLITRAFLPGMLKRRAGHVVNVGSIAGRIALPGNAAYSASKYGLRGLHEVLAAELRGTGVRATLIEPAATDTPLWDPVDPDHRDDLPSRSRMLAADDVARAIVFALEQPDSVEVSHLAIQSAG